jgi:DNA-binding SARP family transcriptional activator
MAHLALWLLGPFQATLDGEPIQGLNSDRLRALLAYLAVECGREHPREALASLLWPERADREALSALRHVLSNLRIALDGRRSPGDRRSADDPGASFAFLLVTRTSVQFNQASDHWLDVAEFDRLRTREDVPGLESAVQLYRSLFLRGLSVANSPPFDDWLLLKQEEYQRSALSVLGHLTSLQMERGRTSEAARWARRQLELDPYREQAHRQLMAALALGGERPAALAQYETCRRLLAQELGCEPDDETQALYAQIRAGPLTLSASPSLIGSAGTLPSPLQLPRRRTPPGRVRSAPGFVGRDHELARLGSLLDRALTGQGGVALIAGEAGSGKTALLDEFARRACLAHGHLIALRGSCNAHGGGGDPYLPFREILQMLAGDVEGKRAGGTLSPEQARRAWDALPAVGAVLAEHGPDLIDTFVSGEALLRRVEGFPALNPAKGPGPAGAGAWQERLRELVRRAGEGMAPPPQPDLFAQVTAVLHAVSVQRPLLLAIDDLQWADGGTAALLFHLGRRLAGSHILLACACRPEALAEPPDTKGMPSGSIWSVLQELGREWGDIWVALDRADGRAFVEAYVDSEPNRLGAGFRQVLYEHTEGNPLFTVELLRSFERARALVQDEAGRWIEAPGLDWDHVPARVEAVIAGHLAGLPEEDRALLGAASIQGEQFAAEVAARVLGWDEEAAVRRLSGPLRTRHRLVQAVSVDRLPSSGQRLSQYRFRHALVQGSAYRSLDAVERVWLHEATARALEAIYGPAAGEAEGERPSELAPALARHYEAAGMRLQAARALHDAGRQAMRLAALREALDLFDHGLTLLADEPPSTQRTEVERLLQIDRLGPQASLRGTGSAELAGDLALAADAGAREVQGRPKLLMLNADLNLLSSRGQFEEALATAGQMLEEATKWDDETFAAFAHFWTGLLHHLVGKPQEADSSFERAIARLTPARGADLRAATGFELAPMALSFSALNQWILGCPDRALGRITQALAGALERGDPSGQAFAYAIGSMILFLLRSDAAALQARAEAGYRLCLQDGITWWQDYTKVFLGWLAVMRGALAADAGIERMRSAIAGWQAKGMAIGTDGLLVVLADACLSAARQCPAAGRSEVEDDHGEQARWLAIGLAAMEPFLGSRVLCGQSFQAELHRLRGELLLACGGLAAAEEALACFRRAMQIGAEQGALAWELRAAMSLVRLLERQAETSPAELAEARQRLREVYARFTEGFAFPDLQDAAALIDE